LTSLALIKYEPTESLESGDQFNNSLSKNFGLMVEEINDLQLQIANGVPASHVCQPCNLEHCSHSDYEKLKKHVCPSICSENYHQKIRLEREKEVIKQINKDCKLGCKEDSNREHIISKIKELISAQGGECLVMIIQLEKESMEGLLSKQLYKNYDERLSQVNDYQQLVKERQAIIREQLAENQQVATVNPAGNGLINTKTILAGSFIITLLTVGGMLIMKSRRNKNVSSLPVKSSLGNTKLPTLQKINSYLVVNRIKSLEIDDEQEGLITRFKEGSSPSSAS